MQHQNDEKEGAQEVAHIRHGQEVADEDCHAQDHNEGEGVKRIRQVKIWS